MANAQKWPDCSLDLKNYVNGLVELFCIHLGRSLQGVYLHGSLAMGCYYFPKSDLDLLVVVSSSLSAQSLKTMGIQIAQYAENCPGKGGLELSIVTTDALQCRDLAVPFELHYSPMWHQKLLAGEVDFCKPKRDPDLSAHFAVVRTRGVFLYGQAIETMFPAVDWDRFYEAVFADIRDLLAEESLLHSPYYGVLNFCRALQLYSSPVPYCFSKEEGAVWALEHLPKPFLPLVRQALDVYRNNAPGTAQALKTGGECWRREPLLRLRDYVLAQIPELSR